MAKKAWLERNKRKTETVKKFAAIRAEIEFLVGKKFRDRDGKERRLELSDILIVAPYNLQVNALKAGLPFGTRVGTVDKFQGQEAPVCIVSMTSSSQRCTK